MTRLLDDDARARLAAARTATRVRHPSTRPHPSAGRAVSRAHHSSGPVRPRARRLRLPSSGYATGGSVLLLAVVTVLCVVGLVMVLSSSSVEALHTYGSAWLFFKRQLLWLVVGGIALLVTTRVDYHVWRHLAVPGLVLCGALLVLVLVPGVGISVSGSSRWLGAGNWRMQPSELCKLALLLFAADLLARRSDRVHEPGAVLRPVLLAFGAVAFLVLRQPDMGTTLVLGCIVLAVLWVGGASFRSITSLVVLGISAAFVVGMAEPYRRARMISFLDPWKDASNTGYQVSQSIVGLADGGITGVGLGASRAKWGFLPNAHTDFIFTIVGEEMGLIGSLLVVGLFVAFAVLGVRTAVRAPDRFGTLVAAGVTAWVAGQAFVNMGAVTGLLPVTGVPLPFVSFGGSSLVIALGAVGVLANVARHPRPSHPSTASPR